MTDHEGDPGTRQRLLDAAARLIPELGWGAVSTRLVARVAGVNPGVVHYHFGSVASLLRQAAGHGTRQAFQGPVERLLARADAAAAVTDLIAEMTGPGPGDTTRMLLLESALAATRDPELRAQTAAMLAEMRELVTRWLAEVTDLDEPASAAAAITAMIDSYLLHQAADPALHPGILAPALRTLLTAQASTALRAASAG